MPSVAKYVKT